MLDLATTVNRIPAMSDESIANVRKLEAISLQTDQVRIDTAHCIHAGLYARTITIPAGIVLTGALIKLATLLIINGHVAVYLDGEATELRGYHVFAASANRKQAFVALSDTNLTMVFATDAKSIAEAEEQFTDEASLLFSRHAGNKNHITITGE